MKKLRLAVEDLRVESFDVREDVPDARGTVRAEQQSYRDQWCDQTDFDHCPPSYEVPCWWTGDPMQDCYPPSELNPCTDYPAYC
jgi:hypothetical protein